MTNANIKQPSFSEFLAAFGHRYNDEIEFCAWDKQNYKNSRRARLGLRPSAIDILKKWSKNGTVNIGFVPTNGRTNQDVEYSNVVFCEFDDGSTLEQQLEILNKTYLPHPSIIIDTGNRSFHFYWLLTDEIEIEEFCKFQKDLAMKIGSDVAISNAARTMRLPFFKHPKTGKTSKVIDFNCVKHQFRFMRKVIPEGNHPTVYNKSEHKGDKTKPILSYLHLLEDVKINERRNTLESRCPLHRGESDTVFFVDLSTGAFKCNANTCSGADILKTLSNKSKIQL